MKSSFFRPRLTTVQQGRERLSKSTLILSLPLLAIYSKLRLRLARLKLIQIDLAPLITLVRQKAT
ncbi:hypothetical protein CKAH01_07150 [Colletotrichum kahawae]|uniref:Uncharacterized protein n=1 Tax=Colletotrichum kahawae TaxID=34407 RepID=A0AAD9Y4Q3_COLKA|nr:hypothetical protein CKAH01_07150 [Colletotrichum kahawae]